MAKQICPACKEIFAGTTAGDRHRQGTWDVPPTHPDYRHCLTPEQMIAKGMRRNEYGYWSSGEGYDRPEGTSAG